MDTKPATVARDLFIDTPSQELATLYATAQSVSNAQSTFSTNGSDLAKLLANYGLKKSSGSAATGVATLTTSDMSIDILIQSGSIFTARNGLTFKTMENIMMSASSANVYKANASRVRQDLTLAGITDAYSIDVNVQALIPGTAGNIGRFSLTSQNIPGIANATNLATFSGGSDQESDAAFRTRFLSIFAGSNTGTSLGYQNALNAVAGLESSIVVQPGDPLMTRDGTQVTTDSSGNPVVVSSGTGGKVDLYVLGSVLSSEVDSFIYNDQSGKNDPTDTSNDVILGEQGENTGLNVNQRRITALANNALPYQPIQEVISVVGSSSGSNFIQSYTDSNGQTQGNYVLEKDTGDFAGSPFGFDKLHWISNTIDLTGEAVSKGPFNGVDSLSFSDVEQIVGANQNIIVTNENSDVSSTDRSILTLFNAPIGSATRVFNLTTGERYVVVNQNLDGVAGSPNTTGRIQISGSTLPTSTDVLQVDYVWVKVFDGGRDYDNLKDYNVNRQTQDSIDWGFGNLVVNEPAVLTTSGGGLYTTVTHPVSKVLSVNAYTSSGVMVNNGMLSFGTSVTNVIDARRVSDGAEVFNTDLHDGALTGSSVVVLPSDTLAQNGDLIMTRINADNLFAKDGYSVGTFTGTQINLDPSVSSNGVAVLVNYEANVSTLLTAGNISDLPVVGNQNQLGSGSQPTSNLYAGGLATQNLRRAQSNIQVTVNSIPSNGSITISGSTVEKVENALVTVTAGSGLTFDLLAAVKSDLGVSALPSTVKVSAVSSVSRVAVNSSNQVTSTRNTYDVVNYVLADNTSDLTKALKDPTLYSTQVRLPATSNNMSNELITGDTLQVTFYYTNVADSDTLYFSRNGTQITSKPFSYVSRVASGYGFQNGSGNVVGTITLANLNQPASNTSYSVDYDYVAPKENERITITYNYNALIDSATQALEQVRPITADVLIKAAGSIAVNATIYVVLLPSYVNQSQTVLQSATDSISAFLTSSTLGTTIDASDLVDKLYSVAGIDRVRVAFFGVAGGGNVLSVVAARNQYLTPGAISIQQENR
jgi:uncharacterized phage protein gp47/JayE